MQQVRRNERILVWLLRVGGVMTVLAFPAALFPTSWMAEIHAWLGLGEFPDQPISGYMARSLSLIYGFHGVLTLILSTDVRRYRPLIGFLGWMVIAFGVAMLLVDLHAGMPSTWTAFEGPPMLLIGTSILYLRRSVPITGV